MALDTTVGGATANSYVTAAEASALIPGLASKDGVTNWTNASVGDQEAALMKAATAIQFLEEKFQGLRSDMSTPQALAWPRAGVWTRALIVISNTVIPLEVKKAQVLIASIEIDGDVNILAPDTWSGIRSEKVGPVQTDYDTALRPTGLGRIPGVLMLLQPFFRVQQAQAYRL